MRHIIIIGFIMLYSCKSFDFTAIEKHQKVDPFEGYPFIYTNTVSLQDNMRDPFKYPNFYIYGSSYRLVKTLGFIFYYDGYPFRIKKDDQVILKFGNKSILKTSVIDTDIPNYVIEPYRSQYRYYFLIELTDNLEQYLLEHQLVHIRLDSERTIDRPIELKHYIRIKEILKVI